MLGKEVAAAQQEAATTRSRSQSGASLASGPEEDRGAAAANDVGATLGAAQGENPLGTWGGEGPAAGGGGIEGDRRAGGGSRSPSPASTAGGAFEQGSDVSCRVSDAQRRSLQEHLNLVDLSWSEALLCLSKKVWPWTSQAVDEHRGARSVADTTRRNGTDMPPAALERE